MANELVSAIKESVLQLPLRAITLKDDTNTVTILHLEAESNITIDPITRTDDEGHPRTVAYELRAEIFVPHNKTEVAWIAYVHAMRNKTISAVIALGAITNWPLLPSPISDTGIVRAINSSPSGQGGYFDLRNNSRITLKLESPERRQRYIITVKSIFRNLFNNKHFSDSGTVSGYSNTVLRRTLDA